MLPGKDHSIRRSGHTVPESSVVVCALGRYSRVVRLGQAVSGGLAAGLATVAAEPRWFSTFRFSGRTYPKLASIERALCAVAGRRCQPLANAVAVTVAVVRAALPRLAYLLTPLGVGPGKLACLPSR